MRPASRSSRLIAQALCVIVIVLASAAGCAHRAASTAPGAWTVTGEVALLEARTMHVRHKSGRVVVLTLNDGTIYLQNGQPASMDDVRVGTRVIVEVQSDSAGDRAARVRVVGG